LDGAIALSVLVRLNALALHGRQRRFGTGNGRGQESLGVGTALVGGLAAALVLHRLERQRLFTGGRSE